MNVISMELARRQKFADELNKRERANDQRRLASARTEVELWIAEAMIESRRIDANTPLPE